MSKRGKNPAVQQTPRARRLAPAARRAQLLACAVRVFARRGIGAARHTEVAAEAGLSVPSVFVYFPSREALVAAVLDEVARFIHDDVLLPLARDEIAADRVLLDSALAFARAVETHPDHARLWLEWSTAVRDDVWPRYLAFQDRVIALLAGTMKRGQREGSLPDTLDTDDAVRLLVGSAHMIAQMQIAGMDAARVRHFIESVIAGFMARPAVG